MRKLLLLVFALLALAGCGVSSNGGASAPTVKTLDASWVGYKNMHDLKAASNLAVLATIGSVQGVTHDEHHTPYTDFSVTVERVLWNPKHLDVNAVSLHQTGSLEGSTLTQFDDDPLFKSGEVLVLFLRQYAPAHFFVTGGPQGRWEVDTAGIAHPMSDGLTGQHPLSVTQLDQEIQTA